MTVAKTALAASVILATLGLAGCQTTEERVYYSEVPSPAVSTTVVYDEPPRVYRPPAVYVDTPPYYVGRPGYYDDRPSRWDRPGYRRPPVYGGPTPDPRWQPRRPPQGHLPGDPGGLRPSPRGGDTPVRPRWDDTRRSQPGFEPGDPGYSRPPRGPGVPPKYQHLQER